MLLALIFRGVAFEFRWRDPAPSHVLGRRLHRRLDRGGARPGHHARRPAAGHRRRRPRLCRRLVGLADAVQPAGRRQPGLRLCAARRHLADHEERRLAARALLSGWRCGFAIATIVAMAAVSAGRRSSPTTITSAGSPGRRCCSPRRCRCWWPSPRSPSSSRCASKRSYWPFLIALALFALGLIGLGISIYPLRRAARGHDLGRRRARQQPGLHAGRARRSWCRSSWPTPAMPTGCSAARPGTRAITDAGAAGSGCGSSLCGPAASA